MSQEKTRKSSWVGWCLSILLILGSVVLWTQRQTAIDTIQYHRYSPSEPINKVTEAAQLTDDAIFTFYATHPSIESSQPFNQHCQRQEADSPILGCYVVNRIYIYDVTDERLEGVETVTAAHELLHAEWDRLSKPEQKKLTALLEKEYQPGTDTELDARMKYYEKTEPGQSINELHSIIGTEFASISPELENHYAKYFKNRQALVQLQQQVDGTFDAISKEAEALVERIEALADKINQASVSYNSDIEQLNRAVGVFNRRAEQTGGFTTQAEFQAARQQLSSQSAVLANLRQQIQSDVALYKTLLAKLDTLNSESASLSKSLDSTLSDIPTL